MKKYSIRLMERTGNLEMRVVEGYMHLTTSQLSDEEIADLIFRVEKAINQETRLRCHIFEVA